MTTRSFFSLILLALISLSGCYDVATDVAGKRCRALSAGEKENLADFSRRTLMNNVRKGLISADEADFALRHDPDVRIEYRGDRYGTADVFWRTPARTVGMRFEGDLTASKPLCALITQDNPHLPGIQPDKSINGR